MHYPSGTLPATWSTSEMRVESTCFCFLLLAPGLPGRCACPGARLALCSRDTQIAVRATGPRVPVGRTVLCNVFGAHDPVVAGGLGDPASCAWPHQSYRWCTTRLSAGTASTRVTWASTNAGAVDTRLTSTNLAHKRRHTIHIVDAEFGCVSAGVPPLGLLTDEPDRQAADDSFGGVVSFAQLGGAVRVHQHFEGAEQPIRFVGPSAWTGAERHGFRIVVRQERQFVLAGE